MNEPIGWIMIKGVEKIRTGGYYSGTTSKLYKSEAQAKSSKSTSNHAKDLDVKIVPVYLKEVSVINGLTGQEILDIPMKENDAGAATIGEYLVKLLHLQLLQ